MTTHTAPIHYTLAPPIVAPLCILGLDISSTAIGWAVYEGPPGIAHCPRNGEMGGSAISLPPGAQNGTGHVRDYGEVYLKHADINHRCRLARAAVGALLRCHSALDAAAIEAPVARFAKALIPQCLVSGAVRSLLAELDIAICDVSPSEAKRALSGGGAASKTLMQAIAAEHGVSGEHAADALGVVLAAYGKVRKI